MPTVTGLLPAAQKAGAIAARYAADGDAERQVRASVVEALLEAGFARYLVPERWGGGAASFTELTRAVAAVGEGCASAAWVGSLLAYTARFAAGLPEEGQAEVWAKGPDTRVVSALAPMGAAEPVNGGWRLGGRWPYTSGVQYADWALVLGLAQDGGAPGDGRRLPLFFALPRDAFTIEDTWNPVGMRGTGSNTLVVDDVFVPAHRSFRRSDMLQGRAVGTTTTWHTAPLLAVNGLTFTAPLLGAVAGALRASADWLPAKKDARGEAVVHSSALQVSLARADGEIDCARLLVERSAAAADAGPLTGEQIARNGRDTALAVELLTTAVDRLFRACGTKGQAQTHFMQRVWRDVHAGASHVALRFEPLAVAYTETLLRSPARG
ncbi:acyl-CoA dehydrogenase family protein [Streptomyces sp. NPDC057702]|uniref:acyl-CoA dehydrogenase family protein n=1 Tax=unclassified Streptomyces TaxID=2593676 RepID=UPI003699C339